MALPYMLSYAQQREDVVLRRGFPGRTGTYVDVGAGHPVEHSVSKYFHSLGWRGVNIEPQERLHTLLEQDRPGDENIRACAADDEGRTELFEVVDNWGWATTVAEVADEHRAAGHDVRRIPLGQTCLDTVLSKSARVRPNFEFLKIDVEGAESSVLDGIDLDHWRLQVIVIESTHPNGSVRIDPWSTTLMRRGYSETLFEGLNSFYVRSDLTVLATSLSLPANVFDHALDVELWRRSSPDERRAFIDWGANEGHDVDYLLRHLHG